MKDQILSLERVAELTGTPLATLRYWRSIGGSGPKTFKLGRRVVALESDVDQWVTEQRQKQAGGSTA